MWRFSRLTVLLLAIGILGCGSGGPRPLKLYPAQGTVTYKGKPVIDCVINLVPSNPSKEMQEVGFTGTLDGDGKFQLKSSTGKSGAAVGKYKVILGLSQDAAFKAMMSGGGKKSMEASSPFPKEYLSATTSKKEVEIEAKSNDLAIVLD